MSNYGYLNLSLSLCEFCIKAPVISRMTNDDWRVSCDCVSTNFVISPYVHVAEDKWNALCKGLREKKIAPSDNAKSKFEYPFELVGPVIEHNGKLLRAIDPSKPMILDGVRCFANDDNVTSEASCSKLFAITKSNYPFSTSGAVYAYAWVEVDAPEPKSVTRPMTAEEIVALGPIWMSIAGEDGMFFGETLHVCCGNLSFKGRFISGCKYAKSSTATEWLKFEVTEVVK